MRFYINPWTSGKRGRESNLPYQLVGVAERECHGVRTWDTSCTVRRFGGVRSGTTPAGDWCPLVGTTGVFLFLSSTIVEYQPQILNEICLLPIADSLDLWKRKIHHCSIFAKSFAKTKLINHRYCNNADPKPPSNQDNTASKIPLLQLQEILFMPLCSSYKYTLEKQFNWCEIPSFLCRREY